MKQLGRRLLLGLLVVAALPAAWWLWGWGQMLAEHDRILGMWELEASEYGGELSKAGERDSEVWLINGGQAGRYVNGLGVNTFEIVLHPNEDPKQIDLIPIAIESSNPAAITGPVAGLYSIQEDTLRLAITLHFSPGGLEEERRRAIEAGKVRPKSFETRKGEVAVLTFKRKKEGLRP